MQVVTTIGLDIAKSVFQVHGCGRSRHYCYSSIIETPAGAAIL